MVLRTSPENLNFKIKGLQSTKKPIMVYVFNSCQNRKLLIANRIRKNLQVPVFCFFVANFPR